ncbi:MAG: precorrin-8X methylmutase [Candidatus Magnetoovum sp. WYHC-5]|nr:precorrin-8X methylmutase [Candidatus Magnetoovum sp. WYHC-5]
MEKPLAIEKESFEIIKEALKKEHSALELPIVQRVIHATGDFEFEYLLKFQQDAITQGIRAIRASKAIFTDVRMVEIGIDKRLLRHFGINTYCHIADNDIVEESSKSGLTRAELSVAKALNRPKDAIGIVAIGNAPTALLKLLELIETNPHITPTLIVGVPVGFVKASESKELLYNSSLPYITCLGTKGGSPVAVSIINALLKLAVL